MKKIWGYIAVFFIGLSAGLLVAIKTAGDKYSAIIRKIKQKGRDGATGTVVFKPVAGSDAKSNRQVRLDDRIAKKQARIDKRKLKNN